MIVSLLSFDISKGLIIRCVTQKVKYVTVGFFLNYATFETDDIFRKGKPGQICVKSFWVFFSYYAL